MPIEPGSRLLHYRVVEKIGEGGMGVVWKGVDTTLDRTVAIKVLPEAFAGQTDRLARFEREAKVLAALSHPNIAGIFGLHEQDRIRFLAMEMVEGEDLADRIARGPIAPDEALAIGLQIAEALEAAHAAGVVHRDLKPANVKVTAEGKVKVLDFGLAKALASDGDAGQADPSLSPTMTSAGSVAGMILGTAAYMSPEQARGQPADARADVWAFGVVLFEMLTGMRLFDGKTVSDVLASVLKSEPDLDDLPSGTPPAVRRLLRRCLAKDPEDRLHHIADARLEIRDALGGARDEVASAPAPPPSRPRTGLVPWAVAALGTLVAVSALWFGSPFSRPESRPVLNLAVPFPPGTELVNDQVGNVAISPTGSHLAVVLYQDGIRKIFLRALDDPTMELLNGTEDAQGPFFSPDGRWLGFVAGQQLKKVSVDGGTPLTMSEDIGSFRGASWAAGDVIIISTSNDTPLEMVPASGGTPTAITTLDEARGERTHRWPQVLPGGDVVLFTVGYLDSSESYEESPIDAVRISTRERKRILQGASFARYVESGHLVFGRGGYLFAVPFDVEALETRGTPVPVMEGVMGNRNSGLVQMDVSSGGTLVFIPGAQAGVRRVLTWANADGSRTPLMAPIDGYSDVQLSPDGRRIAFTLLGGVSMDVWIQDIDPASRTRLTFNGNNIGPTWSKDGQWMAFTSDRDGTQAVYQKRSDNSGEAELLVGEAGQNYRPTSWSPDGRYLTVETRSPSWDILILSVADRTTTEFLRTDANESGSQFSPDGQWIAYRSDESGQDEVYVRPFPGPGGKRQISLDGGREPYWAPDGSRLFFRRGDGSIWAADLDRDGSNIRARGQTILTPSYQQLYSGDEGALYSPDPDGQRFLILMREPEGETGADRVVVVVNWFDELRGRF